MRSAGLLPYRLSPGLEVLVAHPGGPFWAHKDAGAWSIVKGLVDEGEDPRATARREFTEETGWPAPPEPWLALGEVRLKSGKRVSGWAVAGDFDPATLQPEEFTMSLRGRQVTVPEIDRVAWFTVVAAREKLNAVYGEFLDRLELHLEMSG